MKILSVRHDYPEKAGFIISRPLGRKDYTFLHFQQRMEIVLKGEHIVTEPNSCIFFSPDEPQLFYSKNADITHNWMHFSPDAAELLAYFGIPENKILYPKDAKFISRFFYKIEVEFSSNHPFKEELLDGYFGEFLIRFSRVLNSTEPKFKLNSKEKSELQQVRNKVLSSPEYDWSVSKMAKEINLSPSYFHAVYKAMFGTAPMKDVIQNRIQTAKNLLVSTDLTVTEIAEKAGYSNPHHFIRQFKDLTNQTPLNYRKNSR